MAVIIAFRKSNENSIERRAGADWSSRKKTSYRMIANVGFGNVRNQWPWPDFSFCDNMSMKEVTPLSG